MEKQKYIIGQLVARIENRPMVLANILDVYYDNDNETYVYNIAYHEGGTGFWNEDDLRNV